MLTERDHETRKAILQAGGHLAIAAENLGISYDVLRHRLRAKKHQLWWRTTKIKISRDRKRARERRAYANAVRRAAGYKKVDI